MVPQYTGVELCYTGVAKAAQLVQAGNASRVALKKYLNS